MKKLICLLFILVLVLAGCGKEEVCGTPLAPPMFVFGGLEEYFVLAEAAELSDAELEEFLQENGYADYDITSREQVESCIEIVERAPIPQIDGKNLMGITVYPDEWKQVEYHFNEILSFTYELKNADESKLGADEIRIERIDEHDYNSSTMSFFSAEIDGIPAEITTPKMNKAEAEMTFAEITFARTEELKPTEQAQEPAESGAPPAEEFYTPEEIVDHIKTVKAAGVEETVAPNHIGLYEKEEIYLLKESPLPDFEQTAIMLVLQGTAIIYRTENWDRATFFWFQGRETEEKIENLTERFGLKRYEDTKYFIGSEMSDNLIIWWENGDEFEFTYPADIEVDPADIIERIEVQRYDV